MAQTTENRYDDYQSSEDLKESVQQEAQIIDFDIFTQKKAAQLKERQEKIPYGQNATDETLGTFEKNIVTIRGARGRLYSKAEAEVAETKSKVDKINAKIEETKQARELRQEAIEELKKTTRWYQIGKKIGIKAEEIKEDFKDSVSITLQEIPKTLYETKLSIDEWVADVLKGNIEEKYKRAVDDLNSTKKMEGIVNKYYSKVLGTQIRPEDLAKISGDSEKQKLLQKLLTAEGNDFTQTWTELKNQLSNDELKNLYSLLDSRLGGKDRKVVTALRKQIEDIFKRSDVKDYQEIKYLRNVQQNLTRGKEIYLNLNFPKIRGIDSAWFQLEQIFAKSPNIAYMICDAAEHYKDKKQSLENIFQILLKDNNNFKQKFSPLNPQSVNDLVKIDFYVKAELNENRKNLIESLKSRNNIVSVKIPFSIDLNRDFTKISSKSSLYDLAYDLHESLEIKELKISPEEKLDLSVKIATMLKKAKGNRVDPTQNLTQDDFNNLKKAA